MVNRVGQQLGNYRLVRLLGQGGFAEVYLGEHVYLETQAAIKVLQTQLAREDMEQFRLEARTIARLEHPHIVRVLDFGLEGSTPFLVMSYAPNGTLRTRHPKGTRVPLSTVVSYVKQIAPALQYAHEQRLIHRDIKPENLLVGRANEVLLSDFGIALVAQSSRYQSTRDMAGTIAYMAPEQIEAHPRPASDQYSLGIVVYEWLSGDRPFHGSFSEIAIKHSVVPPPSLREKLPNLSPAVEQVVLTALAKDPGQRFASVQAFATALEQAGQVGADAETLPASVTLPATGEKTLRSSTQLSTEIARQPSESVIPTELITPPSQAAALPTEAALLSQPAAVPPAEMPPAGLPHRGISRRTFVVGLAGLAVVGVAGGGLALLSRSKQPSSPSRSLGITPTLPPVPPQTSTPVSLGTVLYTTYRNHRDEVHNVSWSPQGQRIASASADKTVQIWDAGNGGNIFIYTGHSGPVNAAAWAPNGTRIASAGDDHTVQVWDATNGDHVSTYSGHSGFVVAVAWAPDGTRIASASEDFTVKIWDAVNGGLIYTYAGHTPYNVNDVAWSPDGKHIASAGGDKTVQVWDAVDGRLAYTYTGHSSDVNGAAWAPNGKRIASASNDGTVQIWNALDGSNSFTYLGHTSFVYAVAWSPDGTRIASASRDQTVQVWQAP